MPKENEPISLTEWAKRCRIIDEAGDFQQEQWDALCTMHPRKRAVKVWSTVKQQEAEAFFCQMAAGNNQLEKAHFQKAWLAEGAAFDQEGKPLPSLMRPRINTQGTVTGE